MQPAYLGRAGGRARFRAKPAPPPARRRKRCALGERLQCEAMTALVQLAALALQLHVIIPDARNLQDLTFWVALGAGYFHDEEVDVVVDVPDTPGEVVKLLARDDAQVAVLPPPIYLDLISERKPFRLVANLLQNDGMNIIVRRSVMAARKLRSDGPIAERLRALREVRIGVPPGPASRFRALVQAVGLDPAKDFQIVVMTGHEQNEAFAAGKVDALFAHTPFLERALVDQDAVMFVNQSAGEVRAAALPQIHALVVRADFAAKRPALVRSLCRAIARAQKLIHAQPAAAAAAVMKALPSLSRKHVEALVRIYQPAVPATPEVSAAGLRPALAVYPAGKVPPDLSGIDLGAYVLPQFARGLGER
jgi:ABC-type nitrate/sulfonate/bicarbonate transport system substrate-binding protein